MVSFDNPATVPAPAGQYSHVARAELGDKTMLQLSGQAAIDADAAQTELERFDEKWGQRFPVITQAWLNAWEYVIPFLAFPEEVRRVIYTTNAIEALNRQLRKDKLFFPVDPSTASRATIGGMTANNSLQPSFASSKQVLIEASLIGAKLPTDWSHRR